MRKTYFSFLRFLIIIVVVAVGTIFLLNGIQTLTNSDNNRMLSRITAPDGPDRIPNDWMDRQRSYPYGKIRTEAYLDAMYQAKELHSAMKSKTTVNWQFAGPLNIGGRITDIETSSGSSETIYIGAASGGIFKTQNNGETWENIFYDAATLPIGDIDIDQIRLWRRFSQIYSPLISDGQSLP